MNNLNIISQLDVRPRAMGGSASQQIVRGASAMLTFDYLDKVYDFDGTDQLTFMLKQDKVVYWYKMFNYLVPTQDISPIPGKVYYKDVVKDSNSFKCTATPVPAMLGERPFELGYYEEADGNYGWKNTLYTLDSRFFYNADTDSVSMVLYPEDTLNFKAKLSKPLTFEVAVRLNTDANPEFANRDTVLIEPQAPIFVSDSLYSTI